MSRILTNCALFDDCLIIPFHFCCISNSTTPSSFPFTATFASVLPVSPPQTSAHVWFLLAEHGFGSTCLSSEAVCLLFSFSWTCGSLIPVTFLVFLDGFPASPLSPSDYSEGVRTNRELNLSSAWMHRSHLKFCGLGKFTWKLCPIILFLAIWTVWASRMVRPPVSGRSSLPLSVYRAALQAEQVFGL